MVAPAPGAVAAPPRTIVEAGKDGETVPFLVRPVPRTRQIAIRVVASRTAKPHPLVELKVAAAVQVAAQRAAAAPS